LIFEIKFSQSFRAAQLNSQTHSRMNTYTRIQNACDTLLTAAES